MISVVCSVYNEELYINQLLAFCINAGPTDKEVILIDGGSTDNTVSLIKDWASKHNNIMLYHNPMRYVSFALNKGIEKCKGDYIIRLDAHTTYDPDYFNEIIKTFLMTNAQIVGGPMRIAKGNNIQNAIGYVTTSSFGIGNGTFHFEDFEGYTDSIYLGAWKREIFHEIGFFDEAMIRNQDDEFHYRARSKGLKIYQSPKIKAWYHPRDNFKNLFNQYYQYGLYKPLVFKKVEGGFRMRHIIPSMFVLYLFSLPISFVLKLWILPLIMYIILIIINSFSKSGKYKFKILTSFVFILIHISYGLGFINGLWKWRNYKSL